MTITRPLWGSQSWLQAAFQAAFSICNRPHPAALGLLILTLAAADWSAPVEVRHEDELAIAYSAKLDGDVLLVRATIGPGWHTFSMDNKRRVDEKLAGKPAISNDRPTSIVASGALQTVGPWYQSTPKDFSHPELRWFSWGFEGEALFAAKVRRAAAGAAKVSLRGQACTATVCKNIDLAITLPTAKPAPASPDTMKGLEQVR